MSKTVDQRVVEMRFDNKQFEAGVQTSMSTIEKLKQALNFKSSSKGLQEIDKAAKDVNMSGLQKGIETVQARFSALQVAGVTAMATITNAAMTAGANIAKAVTIDPIFTGFQEYETQIGAVQTILANTQSKGTTLGQVNAALDELNKYADMTIYNFTEMTRNIGTFTAAGVGLEESVSAIKGIANLAAVSGSSSMQASQAMYQLSQALAAGRVSLMDWNSVVNAGMGGEVFQTALKRTAENMGTNVDAMIEKYGSFRESLTQGGWLTTEVLTETLAQISGAYSEADLIAQGYSKEQAQAIVELAETAVDAATKVKTFSALIDTTKEALQSGWTNTWEIIFGDFEEAKDLFTGISEALNGVIESSAESRNALLTEGLSTGWKQLLGEGISNEEDFRDTVKLVAKDHGVAIDDMIEKSGSFEKTLKDGWMTTDILAESIDKMDKSLTGLSKKQLEAKGYTVEQAKALHELNQGVKDGTVNLDEYVEKMSRMSGRENVIAGLKNIFTELGRVMGELKGVIGEVFPPATGEQIYNLTQKFKEFSEQFKVSDDVLNRLKSTFKGVLSFVSLVGKAIGAVIGPIVKVALAIGNVLLSVTAVIGDFFTALNEGAEAGDFFGGLKKGLGGVADFFTNIFNGIANGIEGIKGLFSDLGNIISEVASKISNGLGKAFSWLSENVGIGDVLNGIIAALTAIGAFQFADLVKQLKGFADGGIMGLIFGSGGGDDDEEKITDKFKNILDGVHESLSSFTSGIQAGTLLTIAAAIGVLTLSISKLASLDGKDIGKSLGAIGAMMVGLNLSFAGIAKTLSKYNPKGMISAGIAMIAMAEALNIMASAIKKLEGMKITDIAKGLVALGVGMGILVGGLYGISKVGKTSLKSAVAMIAIAKACDMLADALKKFSGMNWEEIGRGLTAMGGALGEVTAALAVLSKIGGGGALLGSGGILITVMSLSAMADALTKFSGMNWEEIGRGLTAMGGALGELTVALGALSKLGGFGAILGSVGILIAVQSLDEISQNLRRLGSMSWDSIGKGLAAMGSALSEIGLVTGALGKIAGFSGILGSASILIAVQGLEKIASAFDSFSDHSWEEVGKGLVGMGGALAEIGLVTGALGKLTGLAGIFGAGAIWIATQGLEDLYTAFSSFASHSWEEIGRGLVGMGGALLELSAISGATGYLTGIAGLVGAGTITLASQGLTELADAFGKFAAMDWDAIGRGLTAMGGALVETAIGSLLNTFSGFGASAISEVAGPLGTLADSVKKWADIDVPDGFGEKLGEIGSGVEKFNFSGWGADAIASMGGSLGTLADSVKKWADVTVPEGLADQLKTLAPGIEAFNFSGWGGDAIGTVAGPLGQLADSVRNWAGVTVPEGMQENLESLATGVEAFNFSWGDSMGSFVEPLANMADSVSKWSDITVPDGMQEGLESLANGCKAFDWSWGNSMESFVEPLSQLGDVLPKYSGLAIATDIGTSIQSLGEGVKSLSDKDPGDLSSVTSALQQLGSAVNQMTNYDFAGAAASIMSFTDALNNINVSTENFANLGTQIISGFVNSLRAGIPVVQGIVTQLAATAVNAFSSAVASASTRSSAAGMAMVNGLANGMRSGIGSLTSSINGLLSQCLSMIQSRSSAFQAAGLTLASRVASGINLGRVAAMAASISLVSGAASSLRGYYGSFYSAGTYVASGFAAGIRSGAFAASIAAAAMANAAKNAANAALDSHSPSREFIKIGGYAGAGLAIGMNNYQSTVSRSGYNLGESAKQGLTKAVSRINDIMTNSIDAEPTITPVLDLSNVKANAKSINNLIGSSVPIDVASNLSSISRISNARNQNGPNDDVINAINKLRGDIGNINNTTYTVNGITYDDGSAIAGAVGDLIRASRIERRI